MPDSHVSVLLINIYINYSNNYICLSLFVLVVWCVGCAGVSFRCGRLLHQLYDDKPNSRKLVSLAE